MSLETLLEAARFIEQQEKRQKNNLHAAVAAVAQPDAITASAIGRGNTVTGVVVNGLSPSRNEHVAHPEESPIHNGHSYAATAPSTAATFQNISGVTASTFPVTLVQPNGAKNVTATLLPFGAAASTASTGNRVAATATHHHQQISNGQHRVAISEARIHDGPTPLNVDEGNEIKRRNGPCLLRSGTREVHNKLEKNRRAHLKECFEVLKRQLPPQADEKKSSNLSILHSALRHIQCLRRKEREYEHEMERLAREKIALQQRLASLKKELSAQWDHIDFTTLLPDQLEIVAPANCVTPGREDSHLSDGDDGTMNQTMYSSTSSLSSAATTSSPGAHAVPIPTTVSVVQQNGTSSVLLSSNISSEALSSSTDKSPPTTATLVHPTLAVPLSQVMGTQSLVVSPTIQLVAGTQGLRVLQASGDRPLTLLQTTGSDRPLALVQTSATHLEGSRLQDTITTSASMHKVVSGGVTLVSAPQGSFRTTGTKGVTFTNGLTLGPAAVNITNSKQVSNSEGNRQSSLTAHMVSSQHGTPISSLAPLTPLVVSQGNQVAHIIAAPSQLNGKVVTAPLLKSVGQVVNAQYLSTATLVKPVVVVSSPSSVSVPPTSSQPPRTS